MATPPLLPVSFLEAIAALIDLGNNMIRTPSGRTTPMNRLPSGHRTVDILDFRDRPWQLPPHVCPPEGDPFQVSSRTKTLGEEATSGVWCSTTSTSSATPETPENKELFLTLQDSQSVEDTAKNLRLQQKWSYEDMDAFLTSLRLQAREHTRTVVKKTVENKDPASFSLILGQYVHGAFTGVTKATKLYPEMTKYVTAWIRNNFPTLHFTSIALNANLKVPIHRDLNNQEDCPNVAIAFGDHSKGGLWIQSGGAMSGEKKLPETWRKCPNGSRVPGHVHECRRSPVRFFPKFWHETQKWIGQRVGMNIYTIRGSAPQLVEVCQDLLNLGFRLDTSTRTRPPCQHVLMDASDPKETPAALEMNSRQCEFDLEGAFEPVKEPNPHAWNRPSRLERMIALAGKFFLNSRRRPHRPQRNNVVLAATGGPNGVGGSQDLQLTCAKEEDGRAEDRGSLEAFGRSGAVGHHDCKTRDGDRLDDPRRAEGDPIIDSYLIEHTGQQEEVEGCPRRSRRWRSDVEVQGAQDLCPGAGRLQPPSGQASMPGEFHQPVVDLHPVRQSMEEDGTSRGIQPTTSGDAGACGKGHQPKRTRISEFPTSSTRSPSARRQDGGIGPLGETADTWRADEPSSWKDIFFNNDDRGAGEDDGWRRTTTSSRESPSNIVGIEASAEIQDTRSEGAPGDLRDQQQRRGALVGSGDGEFPRHGKMKQNKILLEAQNLAWEKSGPLHQLGTYLLKTNKTLKPLLVLLTWVTTGWMNCQPEFLGTPTASLVWCAQQGEWRPCRDDDGLQRRVGCHVFDNKYQKFNWVMDFAEHTDPNYHNKFVALSKGQTSQLQKVLEKNLVDVGEVYSPPRVIKRAEKMGLKPGFALDLATGWDFSRRDHQQEALRLIRKHRPALIVLSPPCTPFSCIRNLTNFKRDPSEVEREWQDGMRHLSFAVDIAWIQIRAGRGFLFEHPMRASSWKSATLEALQNHPLVYTIRMDMCQFGLKDKQGAAHLKPTILLTNIRELVDSLSKRCDRQHEHASLLGGNVAKWSAIYTDSFVDAILKGLRKHLMTESYPVFGMADSWTCGVDHLVCRHFSPRTTMVTPKDCQLIAANNLKFTGMRHVCQQIVGGPTKTLSDDWTAPAAVRVLLPAWTGSTILPLEHQVLLPEPFAGFATWLARGAAHDLHDYQVQQVYFLSEWTLNFPSHHILGEEARDRRQAIKDDPSLSTASPPRIDSEAEPLLGNNVGGDPNLASSASLGSQRRENLNAMDPHNMVVDEIDEDERRVRAELQALPDVKMPEGPDEEAVKPPPADIRRELFRVHRNLGHPDNATLARALKHAGAKPEYIRWVRCGFECAICAQKRRPMSHRPAHLHSRSMPFNEVIGVDLFYIQRRTYLNILDWGTNLQWVEILPDRTSATVARAMAMSWFGHYGPPAMVICDQGPEFTGREFCDLMGDQGVVIHFTDVNSPWQNSRTEKAGGVFKSRLAKVCQEASVITEGELKIAVAETAWMHNKFYDRSGYSPHQRVFGSSLRMPGSLLTDDGLDREFLEVPITDEMKRAREIREKAAKAWMENQDYEAVSRAAKANTRTVDKIPIKPNDRVFVWRSTKDFVGWSGPGVVIQVTDNGRSLWISLRGYLMKASREQTRLATGEESFGVELQRILSRELLDDLESNRIKHYRDVREEGPPDESVESEDEFAMYSPSLADMEVENENPVPEGHPEQPTAGIEVISTTEEASASNPPESSLPPTETPEPTTPRISTAPASRRSSIRVDEASHGHFPFGPIREERPGPPTPYPMVSAPTSWPNPSAPATFLEVNSLTEDEPVKWWKDRARNRWEPIPTDKNGFAAKEAVAYYSYTNKCILLAKKKKESPGQVDFKKLPESLKKVFRKARDKEIKSLIDSGAIRVMSLEESRKFAKDHPEHVLTSRYVDRWKPSTDGSLLPERFDAYDSKLAQDETVAPKSRWTVVGWKDPEVHSIERSALTPLTTSIYLAMQTAASRKWAGHVRDVKTAFLQGMPTTRKQKLAVKMPPCEHFPEYHVEQLILLLTEVYGLVSGPAWWRCSLLQVLVKELGYRVNAFDKCVLTLDADEKETKEDQKKTQGIIVVEVDDILEGGGPRHRQKMALLESRFKFGKITNLMDASEGSGYAGRRLRQRADYSFSYSMDDYVENRLRYVKIDRRFTKKAAPSLALTTDEESQLRGAIAALNWAAREGRPDASAPASILAGCFPNPSVADVLAVNKAVETLKATKVELIIHAFPENQIRHVVISDSSFDPSGKQKPQHGWLQAITTPGLNRGERTPISLIAWKSKRLKRKAGNTLLCESISLSTAVGALEKQVATWASFTRSKFRPQDLELDISEEVRLGLRSSTSVIASDDKAYSDPAAIAISDSKSLFDALHAEQAHGEDDRSALEVAIIQESLLRLGGRVRWIPHNVNPSDALTKVDGAHVQPLIQLLRTNCFRLEAESDILAREKQGDRRLKSSAN